MADKLRVGRVPKINYRHGYVAETGPRLVEEDGDVLNHPVSLFSDIAGMENFPFIVYARRTGDEHVLSVAIGNGRAPFESNTVFVGRVEVRTTVKILYLARYEALHGVSIHFHQDLGRGVPSLDARAGNIMGFLRQILRGEDLLACFYHPRVVYIHVLNKEPSPYAVFGELATLLRELQDVIVEDEACLILRIGGFVEGAARPQVRIGAMGDLEHPVLVQRGGNGRLQVGPHRYFRAIHRRLLDDR